MTFKNEMQHKVTLGSDVFGNIQRIDNALESIPEKITKAQEQLENTKVSLRTPSRKLTSHFHRNRSLLKIQRD